jgi:protocatechuate 3,4-dioxygenase, beta subunit
MIDPPYNVPDYRSTALRAPAQKLVPLPTSAIASSAPTFSDVPEEADLTVKGALGERIKVVGRLLDGDGRPIAGQLVEIWQANAAGRYAHEVDQHPAPLDPNFTGVGRCLTDTDGSWTFLTIKPGAYPWGNHPNAWRPAHIHFSVFGRSFAERLVTQMYFPGDPLLPFDPIFNSVRDVESRNLLIASFDWDTTEDTWALGYRFDIVIGGHLSTPTEQP